MAQVCGAAEEGKRSCGEGEGTSSELVLVMWSSIHGNVNLIVELDKPVIPGQLVTFVYIYNVHVHVNKAKQGKVNGSTQGRQLISKKKLNCPIHVALCSMGYV